MTDYLYSSARVRSLESELIGRERIEVLLHSKSASDMTARLREYGVELMTDAESGRFLREETLLQILRRAYTNVQDMLSDDKAVALWRYPYDCNNIKAAIKGFIRKIDPRSMMFDFGTVDIEEIIRMVERGEFETLPAAMCSAAKEAVAAYAKTKDPQQIDLLLDCACYADMLSAAEESRVAFASLLVRQKIDLTNLLICVRILRMQSGEVGKLFLKEALIEGGDISLGLLEEWFKAGEEMLWERLAYTQYAHFCTVVRTGSRSLTSVERSADDFFMETLKTVKFIPYGVEVAIAYLLAHEYEVKNLRILFAGKEAGLSSETIRERIRESYV